MSSSVSEWQENLADIDLFLVDLAKTAAESAPLRLTHNEGVEVDLRWAPDNRHLFFRVDLGSVERKYEDPQPRLYWIDTESSDASGKMLPNAGSPISPEKSCITRRYLTVRCLAAAVWERRCSSCRKRIPPPRSRSATDGTGPTSLRPPRRIVRALRSVIRPSRAPRKSHLADGLDKLAQARPITSFNQLFTERELPKAKPYHWTSEDGTPIEGMLMYPPGKFEAKNLPVFVFIHGGPQDADGDHFEANW